MDTPNYYGVGAKFPLQVNLASGRFMTNTEAERIKESIYLILMTNRGERMMRPEYGARLMSYTFENENSGLNNIFAAELRGDITDNEPRVRDVEIELDSHTKPGCLFITIDYVIKATGSKDNMVFPFYLDTSSDEEE